MLSHDRPRNFADVDIAARIDREPVWRDELPRFWSGENIAETCQSFTRFIVYVHAVAQVRRFLIDAQPRTQLADVADRVLFARIHIERAGPVQVIPLGLVLAVSIENLHPVIFAVRDVNPTVFVGYDVVHDVELTGV